MLYKMTLQASGSVFSAVPCPTRCSCRCSSLAGCCQNQCWWGSHESLRGAQSLCLGLKTCEVKLPKNKNKEQFYINMNTKCPFFVSFFCFVFPLTGARDDSKNIFVQAGVQKGAGPGRCHQWVGKKWIFSSILRKKTVQQFNAHKHTLL